MNVRGEQQPRLRDPSRERLLHVVRPLDKDCRAAVHAVCVPQWLPAMRDRRLENSVPDPLEDEGPWEAMR